MLVEKRQTILSILIVVLLALTFSLDYGCSSGVNLDDATGTRAVGTTDTSGIASRKLPKSSYFAALASKVSAVAPLEDPGGDALYDKRLTPDGYSVALQFEKLYLSTDAAGSPSYTVFDTGDITNPSVIDLVTGYEGSFGENGDYPPAGVYDREQYRVVYLDVTLPVDGVTGTYRLYMSTVGSYRQGDFLYNDNGTWKWIDSTDGSYVATRPAAPMTLDLTGQPDPYDQTESLSTPITMPSNPTGYYKIKVTFDVTDCFFWDDNDDDGLFEPAGHDWQQNVNALDGSGFNFWPGPPAETWAVEHVT